MNRRTEPDPKVRTEEAPGTQETAEADPAERPDGTPGTQEAEGKDSADRPEEPVFRISVRRMVEFLLRSGDLDNRSMRGTDPEAALAGGRAHRKLQKAARGDYEAEVPLTAEFHTGKLVIRVEGRADGVIDGKAAASGKALPVIEEIKGMYLDVSRLTEPFPLHLAQAKCYAAMYAAEHGCAAAGVRLTYVSLETEETRRFNETYPAKELTSWFDQLVKSYERWAGWQLDHRRARDRSMKNLSFPFPYREGQKKLTAAVYHTIREKEELFLMAPTGVGKTMSCVYPSVRAVGEGHGDRIFYLTAKNETLRAGLEAFALLKDRGLDFRTVLITSKEKICPMNEPSCNPDDCPFAKGHFDRVNDAVFELLTTADFYDRDTLLAEARARTVCPFELTLDVAGWCDAILCDYNYVFDPDAQLKRFFGTGVRGDCIFLIDEAHNLVERGRDMYSAELLKEDVLKVKRLTKTAAPKIARAAERVNRLMLALRHETEENPAVSVSGDPCRVCDPADLAPVFRAASGLWEAMSGFFSDSGDGALKEQLLDSFFALRSFVRAAERNHEHDLAYTERTGEGFRLKLLCVNPASLLTDCLDRGRAAVLFSATLLPLDYYRTLLTTREDAKAVYAESPFAASGRLLLVAADVSTRFTDRGETMYRRIASYIARTARARTGNYLVFFPSYRMMKDVFKVFRDEFDAPDLNWVVQRAGMQEDDRDIFLENFYEDPPVSLIGFCVMGGVFSEGLDLAGTRLIGAVVVGAGLPQVSNERELLKRFFDEENRGFDYAYRYPGMNKVEQAAGRVIRTADDRGVILLLDSRLLGTSYRRLFPREWRSFDLCTLDFVDSLLRNFWESVSVSAPGQGKQPE